MKYLVVLMLLILYSVQLSHAQSILEEGYNGARTCANLSETTLTTANVNSSQFGKLITATLDGAVMTQPLYVPSVSISGGTHNVLVVATMDDVVYALDAGNLTQLWKTDFKTGGESSVSGANLTSIGDEYDYMGAPLGILSTPTIDTGKSEVFVLAHTWNGSAIVQKLHALSLTTGAEEADSPVIISGSNNGLTFTPNIELQRTGLAIANGQIFIAWASFADENKYQGWVMAYKESDLSQSFVWNTTNVNGLANVAGGGVWDAGSAPVVDGSNNVFYVIGNGFWDGVINFGQSVVRFSTTSSSASLADYFTPSNWSTLNGTDADMGSSGVLEFSGLLVFGAKDQNLRLLNASNLGHLGIGDPGVIQQISLGSAIYGTGAFYARTSHNWFYSSRPGTVQAFNFNGTNFDTPAASTTSTSMPQTPGMAVSSNGDTNGILWVYTGAGKNPPTAGTLYAFDATNLSTTLWTSNQNATRDATGNWDKWRAPTVANGFVYIGTYDGTVVKYGELNSGPVGTGSASLSGQASISNGSLTVH